MTEHEGVWSPIPVEWIDKLSIRELIERSLRYVDDGAGERLAELFTDDGVLQLAGTVFAGREAIAAMFGPADERPRWTEPAGLLREPGTAHHGSNPVIDLDGDTATAETDLLVLRRVDAGKAKITLVARYRDRLRRDRGHHWLITNRTGVSLARPGDEGTDAEWARALDRMPAATRASFRYD